MSLAASKVPEILSIPKMRSKISNYFIHNGFNEIITQNMLDPKNTEIYTDNPVRISNPLGEELSSMRPSIVPAMLRTIEKNLRLSSESLKFFEIGKTFHKTTRKTDFIDNYLEKEELIIAISGKNNPVQWGKPNNEFDFYDIKGITEDFLEFFGYDKYKFQELENKDTNFSSNALSINIQGDIVGILGQTSKNLLKEFNINKNVFILNIDLSKFYKIRPKEKKYSAVSPYPSINRDLAFIVDRTISANDMLNIIKNEGTTLLKSLNIFDVFEDKSLGDNHKSIAFSMSFASTEKTLTDKEVEPVINKIIKTIEKKFHAELRKN